MLTFPPKNKSSSAMKEVLSSIESLRNLLLSKKFMKNVWEILFSVASKAIMLQFWPMGRLEVLISWLRWQDIHYGNQHYNDGVQWRRRDSSCNRRYFQRNWQKKILSRIHYKSIFSLNLQRTDHRSTREQQKFKVNIRPHRNKDNGISIREEKDGSVTINGITE